MNRNRYNEGDVVRIKESVDAHCAWKGRLIRIVDMDSPTVPGKFKFEIVNKDGGINHEHEIFSCFGYDEVEMVSPKGESCGHRLLYHDNRGEYVCPWCEL